MDDRTTLQYSSKELRNDKEVVLEAVKYDGMSLEYASEELLNDKEVVLEAVKENRMSLQYASEELRNDALFFFSLFKSGYDNGYNHNNICNLSSSCFKYLGSELRNDKEYFSIIMNGYYGILNLQYASDELRNDKEVVLQAVKESGRSLRYASEELQKDKELVLEAVKTYPFGIKYYRGEIDLSFARRIVSSNGNCLEHIPEKFKKRKEVVIAAIANDVTSLQFSNQEIQNDPDILCMISILQEKAKITKSKKEVEKKIFELKKVEKDTRIIAHLKSLKKEEISKLSPSKDYREEFCVDFDKTIHDVKR